MCGGLLIGPLLVLDSGDSDPSYQSIGYNYTKGFFFCTQVKLVNPECLNVNAMSATISDLPVYAFDHLYSINHQIISDLPVYY